MASINSWNINYNTNIVSVTFDSNISAINTSAFNIVLNYFGSNLDPIPLSNSIVYGLGTSSLALVLDEDQVITLTNYAPSPSLLTSDYYLDVGTANSTSPALTANVSLNPTSVTPKTTPLSLLRYDYIVNSPSDIQLSLLFNDILNTDTQNANAITLSNLATGNSYTLTGGAVNNPTSYTVVITLNSTDRAALATRGIAQSEESTYLQLLTSSGFTDAWSNPNQLILTPLPVNQYLTTKPTYQGQDLGYVRQPLSRIFLLGGSEGQYIQTDGEGNLTFASPDEYSDFKVAQYLPAYTGNLAANNLTVTGRITASGNITTTANISGNYFLGNGALLSGIATAQQVYGNANVAAYLPTYAGNLQSVTGNVAAGAATFYGNVVGNTGTFTGLVAVGNLTSNTGTFLGNVTANNFSAQTNVSLQALNVVGSGNLNIVSNGNIVLYSASNLVTTQSDFIVASVQSNGNISGNNLNLSNNVIANGFANSQGYLNTNNIVATSGILTGNITAAGAVFSATGQGNVTANFFLGNGRFLTGLANSDTIYGNSNVAAYLPTYTGNLVSLTGNVITTANVSANYILGNGAFITGLPAPYSNANVANYLPFYSGNLSAANINVGSNVRVAANVTAGYYFGNGAFLTGIITTGSNGNSQDISSFLYSFLPTYTGSLPSVTGNIAAGNANFNGNVYGNTIGNLIGNSYGNLTGNVTGTTITLAGNITTGGILTNNIYYANGVRWDLQEPAGSNTQVQYNDGNGNFGASSTFTFDRSTNTLSVTNLSTSVTGNITGATATFTSNITGGNLITSGNTVANFFLGNGRFLSGLANSDTVYSNANVAAYLPTYTGNIGAGNAIFNGNVIGVSVTASGNVVAGNLLTNNLYYANGVAWDLQDPAGSNTQVQYNDGNGNFGASSTFTWNRATNTLSATNIVGSITGNIVGNISGTTATFTGNVDAGNVNSTFYGPLTGNVIGNVAGNLIGNSYGLHTGNVTGTTATFTGNVTAGNVNSTFYGPLTGNVIGNVVGNVAGNISGTTATFTGNVTATNLNITNDGIFGGNVSLNNLSAGYGTYTGNVIAQNFIGNVSGTNINLTGNVIAAGNVTSNNLAATNFISAGSNVRAGGNLVAGSNLVVTGYATIGANTVIQGNLQVVGNIDALQFNDLEIGNLNIILAANATTPSQANGAGIIANGAVASILYNSIPNIWISSHGIQAPGFATPGTVTANLFVGNIQGNVVGNFTINAGANREILFNNQGNVSANSGLQFDYDTQVLTVASNITAGNVNSRFFGPVTGNVSGNVAGNLIGNSYGLHTGNVVGSVTGNITGTTGTFTGNVDANNITVTSNVTVSGNIQAAYYLGNGRFLTGLANSDTIYGNSNVAGYLPTYTGNLVSLTGNVVTSANVNAGFFNGNGRFLTGLVTTDQLYSNANVANYLPTYSGNLQSITGNVAAGNATFSGNVYGNTTGNLIGNSYGNVTGNLIGNSYGNITGNLIGNSYGNLIGNVAATVISVTGNISAGGVLTNNIYYANGAQWDLQDPAGSNTQVQYNDGNSNFGASSAFTFNRATNTLSTVNITATNGTYSNSVTGVNIIATDTTYTGNLVVTGTITGGGGNGNVVISPYSNANVAAYLPTYTGNLVSLTGNVITTANVSAGYLLGNGAFITGLPAQYSNANVANYLPTYTGNIVSLTGNVQTTANVNANFFNGNGRFLTGLVSSDQLYSNANVANYLPVYTGNIQAGNISVTANISANTFTTTGSGNLNLVSTTGNIVLSPTGDVITAANVQANYYAGNGRFLTGLVTSDQLYSNANVANYLPTYTGNLASLTGNVITTANIQSSYLLGNGAFITGLPAQYSNANVANYLPIYTGNIQAGNISVTANISATSNITANYFLGNGAFLTGITASAIVGSYSNANVANYLPTYSGNLQSVTGNVAAGAATFYGNVVGNTGTFTGNVNANIVNATGTGNLVLTSDSTLFLQPSAGNVVYANSNIITTGYYIGNGRSLTGISTISTGVINVATTASNVVISGLVVANSNITAVGNIQSGNVIANTNVITAGLVATGNITAAGAVIAVGNITTTANVTANYFLGNGAFLTGLPLQYSNANVANYLLTNTGNISANNIIANGLLANGLAPVGAGNLAITSSGANVIITAAANVIVNSGLNVTGNISATAVRANYVLGSGSNREILFNDGTAIKSDAGLTYEKVTGLLTVSGNVSASYILANGAFLTGLPASYSNANVDAYLPVYGGNILANIINANTGNFSGPISTLSSITASNNIVTSANVSGAYFLGNIVGTTANFAGNVSTGNIQTTQLISNISLVRNTLNVLGNATINNGLNVGGNTVIAGNLRVTGNITYIDVENLNVTDKNITIANGAVTPSDANGGGIYIDGANANFYYDFISNSMILSHPFTSNGNITATNYYFGNGAYLTGVSNYSNANVAAYLPSYTGNLSPGNLLVTNLLHPNGQPWQAVDFSGYYSNSNVQNYLPTYSGNLVNITGNVGRGSNVTFFLGDVYGNSYGILFGNVVGQSLIGNLTGSVSGNVLGNLIGNVYGNVAGNISGDIGEFANAVFASGNIQTSANIQGAYLLGNGAFITGLPAQYSNANVANYLPTYLGNLDSLGNITITGNINSGGNLTLVGNVLANTGLFSNINTGNISAVTVDSTTGIFTNVFIGSSIVANANGNVYATNFIGNVVGNITGNITGNIIGNIASPGSNTQVLFNNNGVISGNNGLTYNYAGNVLAVSGNVTANNTISNNTSKVGNVSMVYNSGLNSLDFIFG